MKTLKTLTLTLVLLLSINNSYSQWVTKTVDNKLDAPYKISYCSDALDKAFIKLEVVGEQLSFYLGGSYFCDDMITVDVAGAVGCNEQLDAVVGHADRPRAGHRAQRRRNVAGVDLVELRAADDKRSGGVVGKRPQPSDRASAECSQQTQPRSAVEKRRLLACFRHDLREQVDHAAVRSVDAAGHIGGAKDGRLHAVLTSAARASTSIGLFR